MEPLPERVLHAEEAGEERSTHTNQDLVEEENMLVGSKSTLQLISYRRIMEEPFPEIHWLVEPLITVGDRVLVYGPWGSFKSWLLLHLYGPTSMCLV